MKTARTIMSSFVLSASALAQTNGTFQFRVSGGASPSNPTVTVEVWGAWDQPSPDEYYWSGGNLDLVASEGVWSSPRTILTLGPGSNPGQAAGSRVAGILVSQFVCGSFGCITPNTSNPYPLVRVEWTTSDFTLRTVDLSSEITSYFVLGRTANNATVQLFPGEFTPGSGVIQVVPAPGATLLIGLPLALSRRRRRCGSAG